MRMASHPQQVPQQPMPTPTSIPSNVPCGGSGYYLSSSSSSQSPLVSGMEVKPSMSYSQDGNAGTPGSSIPNHGTPGSGGGGFRSPACSTPQQQHTSSPLNPGSVGYHQQPQAQQQRPNTAGGMPHMQQPQHQQQLQGNMGDSGGQQPNLFSQMGDFPSVDDLQTFSTDLDDCSDLDSINVQPMAPVQTFGAGAAAHPTHQIPNQPPDGGGGYQHSQRPSAEHPGMGQGGPGMNQASHMHHPGMRQAQQVQLAAMSGNAGYGSPQQLQQQHQQQQYMMRQQQMMGQAVGHMPPQLQQTPPSGMPPVQQSQHTHDQVGLAKQQRSSHRLASGAESDQADTDQEELELSKLPQHSPQEASGSQRGRKKGSTKEGLVAAAAAASAAAVGSGGGGGTSTSGPSSGVSTPNRPASASNPAASEPVNPLIPPMQSNHQPGRQESSGPFESAPLNSMSTPTCSSLDESDENKTIVPSNAADTQSTENHAEPRSNFVDTNTETIQKHCAPPGMTEIQTQVEDSEPGTPSSTEGGPTASEPILLNKSSNFMTLLSAYNVNDAASSASSPSMDIKSDVEDAKLENGAEDADKTSIKRTDEQRPEEQYSQYNGHAATKNNTTAGKEESAQIPPSIKPEPRSSSTKPSEMRQGMVFGQMGMHKIPNVVPIPPIKKQRMSEDAIAGHRIPPLGGSIEDDEELVAPFPKSTSLLSSPASHPAHTTSTGATAGRVATEANRS
ncbi:hypothetical protein Ddc_03455 [Ditylenchus destructor]|nr:hypothetical protein Ddc_03455 [Ditylenchus destructor]